MHAHTQMYTLKYVRTHSNVHTLKCTPSNMHAHTQICMHTLKCTHSNRHAHTQICTHTLKCTHLNMHAHTQICTHTLKCTHSAHTQICTHTLKYARINSNVHTQIYAHTHTPAGNEHKPISFSKVWFLVNMTLQHFLLCRRGHVFQQLLDHVLIHLSLPVHAEHRASDHFLGELVSREKDIQVLSPPAIYHRELLLAFNDLRSSPDGVCLRASFGALVSGKGALKIFHIYDCVDLKGWYIKYIHNSYVFMPQEKCFIEYSSRHHGKLLSRVIKKTR